MHIRSHDRHLTGLAVRIALTLVVLALMIVAPAGADEQTDPVAVPQSESTGDTGMMMKRPCKKKMGMGGMHGSRGAGGQGKGGMMSHKRHAHGDHRHGSRRDIWKASLSDAQRQEIKTLKVAHMKVMLPLKMRVKAAKAELTALATADTVDQAALEAKIDDLLWHKRLKLIEKYRFMAAKRQVLTTEQRLDFDMAMLKRTKHRKKDRHGKH